MKMRNRTNLQDDNRTLLLLVTQLAAVNAFLILTFYLYGGEIANAPEGIQYWITIIGSTTMLVFVMLFTAALYLKTGVPNLVMSECPECGEMRNVGRLRCPSCSQIIELDDRNIGDQLLWFVVGYSLLLASSIILIDIVLIPTSGFGATGALFVMGGHVFRLGALIFVVNIVVPIILSIVLVVSLLTVKWVSLKLLRRVSDRTK